MAFPRCQAGIGWGEGRGRGLSGRGYPHGDSRQRLGGEMRGGGIIGGYGAGLCFVGVAAHG